MISSLFLLFGNLRKNSKNNKNEILKTGTGMRREHISCRFLFILSLRRDGFWGAVAGYAPLGNKNGPAPVATGNETYGFNCSEQLNRGLILSYFSVKYNLKLKRLVPNRIGARIVRPFKRSTGRDSRQLP